MDEALTVEVHAVHEVGRQLAADDASDETWRRYREWRDRVLATADELAAA